MPTHDALIIGGGPAGLNAALILARCAKRTLICDSGKPRNAASRGLHGYLSRDGIPPAELRALGRRELSAYPTIEWHDTVVCDAERRDDLFHVHGEDGVTASAPTLLLATGRIDHLPAIDGFAQFYGRGVYHCPICDAWEHRGKPMAVYGDERSATALAHTLTTWSREILVCLDPAPDERHLDGELPRGARLAPAELKSLEGTSDGRLSHLRLANGDGVACEALFFCSDCSQRSSLPERLGCQFDEKGSVICRGNAATGVPGLFVAGNVRGGIHLAIMAAAEGAEAGLAMNDYLLDRIHVL
jgi:thioredoxin reductase